MKKTFRFFPPLPPGYSIRPSRPRETDLPPAQSPRGSSRFAALGTSVHASASGSYAGANRSAFFSSSWPRYVLIGVADVLTIVGLQEFFYDQVPDSLRSLGLALYLSILSIGSFLGGMLVSAIDGVTRRGGGEGWFLHYAGKYVPTTVLAKWRQPWRFPEFHPKLA
jgi:hypothetical protein